jgi:hypothetical protein
MSFDYTLFNTQWMFATGLRLHLRVGEAEHLRYRLVRERRVGVQ